MANVGGSGIIRDGQHKKGKKKVKKQSAIYFKALLKARMVVFKEENSPFPPLLCGCASGGCGLVARQ